MSLLLQISVPPWLGIWHEAWRLGNGALVANHLRSISCEVQFLLKNVCQSQHFASTPYPHNLGVRFTTTPFFNYVSPQNKSAHT